MIFHLLSTLESFLDKYNLANLRVIFTKMTLSQKVCKSKKSRSIGLDFLLRRKTLPKIFTNKTSTELFPKYKHPIPFIFIIQFKLIQDFLLENPFNT